MSSHEWVKQCTKCLECKPLAFFQPHAQTRDGRNSWCRVCSNVLTLKYKKANRDKVLAWKAAARGRKAAASKPHDAHVGEWRSEQRRLQQFARLHDAHVMTWARRLVNSIMKPVRLRKAAEAKKAWLAANPDVKRAKKAERRASKLNQTPVWANKKAIRAIYRAAKKAESETGIPWHVDHIVPLNHPLVSGLHCEANLRPFPAVDNIEKGNRWWPDMPE